MISVSREVRFPTIMFHISCLDVHTVRLIFNYVNLFIDFFIFFMTRPHQLTNTHIFVRLLMYSLRIQTTACKDLWHPLMREMSGPKATAKRTKAKAKASKSREIHRDLCRKIQVKIKASIIQGKKLA